MQWDAEQVVLGFSSNRTLLAIDQTENILMEERRKNGDEVSEGEKKQKRN